MVGRDAFIDEGVTIGDRVKIQNAALVYHGVTVEDGVFIGPNAILTNDRFPRAITATGALARADDWTVSPILLRTGASIGAGAVVVAGTTVGRFATVGAGAVVTRDVPDHALVAGNPARRIGWVCACGAAPPRRRRGHPSTGAFAGAAACAACGAHYLIEGDDCVARPSAGGSLDDPDLQAGHRRRRGAGRPGGPALGHARHGQADRRRSRRPGPPTAASRTPS